jgi:transposase
MYLSREDILKVYYSGPDAVVALVQELCSRLTQLEKKTEQLTERVQYLESIITKDSHNSSKPPSSDGFKKPKRTASLREKSGRRIGGQKGHKGHQLEMVNNPDHIKLHRVTFCRNCRGSLENYKADNFEKRQIFELPPLHIEVTEHQAEIKLCPDCGTENRAVFSSGVEQRAQYGPRLKALAVYMMNGNFIPYDRLAQFFAEVFHHSVSPGSLYNFNRNCYNLLELTENRIKQEILNAPVVHFDETGTNLSGKNHWLHSASTLESTFYSIHKNRGGKAFEDIGILGSFSGVAVHDNWKSYFYYSCSHSLCNAHHLRELTFLDEEHEESWAGKMKKCLRAIKSSVDYFRNKGKEPNTRLKMYYEDRYGRILRDGFRYHREEVPAPKNIPKKRGKKAQSPGKNMLDHLRKHKISVLTFMHNLDVPFDNNQAERDIRMSKLKDKISGCYRSLEGAQFFCRIRGFISTVRKRKLPVLCSIENVFLNQAAI